MAANDPRTALARSVNSCTLLIAAHLADWLEAQVTAMHASDVRRPGYVDLLERLNAR